MAEPKELSESVDALPTGSNLGAQATFTMLDVVDFVTERGGNPEAVRESQRRRHASAEAVDEVIALYEDHRKSVPSVSLGKRQANRYLRSKLCRYANR